MLPPVVVDLGPDAARDVIAIVVAACNDAIASGACVPAGGPDSEAARAIASARPRDGALLVVRIEVQLGATGPSGQIVRELKFARKDPLRERWRSVGLAIATLVGEEERRAREEAAAQPEPAAEPEPPPPEPPPPEPPEPAAATAAEPSPRAAERAPEPPPPEPEPEQRPRPPRRIVVVEEEQEPEPPADYGPHRPLFLGLGVAAGPGFGDGAWRLGGNLRAGYASEGGLQALASFGYAWQTSTQAFTAEWASLDLGIGYRFQLSPALGVGALLFGGLQRMSFENDVQGVSRSEAQLNPRVGLGADGRWQTPAGFGVWLSLEASSLGRESVLFVAPGQDPVRSSWVDVAGVFGLGWWLR